MAINLKEKDMTTKARTTKRTRTTPEQDVDEAEAKQPVRPASHDGTVEDSGTFDVDGAAALPEIPVACFTMNTREFAKAVVAGVRAAPNFDQGDPNRARKVRAKYIQAVIQHLAGALERI